MASHTVSAPDDRKRDGGKPQRRKVKTFPEPVPARRANTEPTPIPSPGPTGLPTSEGSRDGALKT
ncbi:hypothetical protein BO71DRAFT_187174 [Aspergillus ellipticus CBS 707.79]|uniref:Uncharacterized protein n=1 Tax=Aspergillus ellipticus CBS 707.79 TaxID=1448320 RepID=A0A319CSV3_9EURO|nr:hypothetical protein BO71DRAFT_187174 [Aspergillus ellipticus CBS 707.79]